MIELSMSRLICSRALPLCKVQLMELFISQPEVLCSICSSLEYGKILGRKCFFLNGALCSTNPEQSYSNMSTGHRVGIQPKKRCSEQQLLPQPFHNLLELLLHFLCCLFHSPFYQQPFRLLDKASLLQLLPTPIFKQNDYQKENAASFCKHPQ